MAKGKKPTTPRTQGTLDYLILTFKGLGVLCEMLILQGEIQASLSSELPEPVVTVSNEALNFFS